MRTINKVVFIDDDIQTTDYHKYILGKFKIAEEALFFTDADEALSYFKGIESKYDFPDLIFVDINMPKMNGHEFVDEVTDIPAFNQNRTIIAHLTTSTNPDDVAASQENEVERYFQKPLTEQMLAGILKRDFNIDPSQQ